MSTLRFLLLEDNLLDAELVQAMLLDGGIDYELQRVDTRADFVTALLTDEFDLILADYTLPDFNGIDALEIARKLCSETPFIFVSASLGEELAIETLKRGATDYVLKKRLGRLVPCVQRALHSAKERHSLKQASLMLVEQNRLLELIASGRPRDECLTAVCASVSVLNPRTRACFLLTDAQRLTFNICITPDFGSDFGRGLKDAPINDLCIGTCGEAVYCGQPVTCADIVNDGRWSQEWRDLCVAHGVLACYSAPVLNVDRKPLGSLMLCFDEARMPTDWEHQLANFGTQVASIVFERERSNVALYQNEARLRAVVANLPNGAAFIVDRDLRYLLAEGNALRDAGMTSEDLVGKTLWQALDPTLATRYEPYYRQALAGEPFSLEHYSHERYYISHGTPIRNERGEVDAVLVVSYDMTQRKRTEEALRESEERLQGAFAIETVGVIFFRVEGGITNSNDAFLHMSGYSREDFEQGRVRWDELTPPEWMPHSQRAIEEFLTMGRTTPYEKEYIRKDGSRWWGLFAASRLNEIEGVEFIIDISDRKEAEAEREKLLQQEQATREAAESANRIKDQFLAVLSHELRSPLNPILGWTRLLQNGKLDAARQREALATIERNAKLQSQLIEDLLDISRIMQGKLTLTAVPVSLTFVISAAVETVRLAAEANNIQIKLDLDKTIAPIYGDANRLQQMVWNLLTNAVKFTPNSGQVTIELRQLDRLAQIRVIDTGKGINPNFLPHVFEYFQQEDGSTTRKFGGLGLGLAIVRQIVEMHGGTVRAESRGENQGATFIVQLPAMQQVTPIESEPIPSQVGTEAPLNNIQILLVDDDTDSREFQAFLLQQSGAKVTAVTCGLEALQALDQLIPDVLVSDVGMSKMDGYMLMQQIRARRTGQGKTIRAIALTAYATEQDRQKAIQAGFQMHITKPVEPERLVSAIVSLLKHNP